VFLQPNSPGLCFVAMPCIGPLSLRLLCTFQMFISPSSSSLTEDAYCRLR